MNLAERAAKARADSLAKAMTFSTNVPTSERKEGRRRRFELHRPGGILYTSLWVEIVSDSPPTFCTECDTEVEAGWTLERRDEKHTVSSVDGRTIVCQPVDIVVPLEG